MEVPSSEVFSYLYSGQIDKLWSHERDELKPYLPFICSIALSPSPLTSNEPEGDQESFLIQNNKETLHSLLCDIEETNIIKNYFKLDFTLLRSDALKEQGLLRKLGSDEERPREREEDEERPAIVFERGNEEKRFRLLLREILKIMSHLESSFGLEVSDLFECQVWLNEISYILCIAVKELNDILPLVKVCEALLRVKNGPYLICRLLANEPHHYKKIVTSLVTKGETLDEISLAGRLRSQTLRGLVTLVPSSSSYVQWLAYTNQKLPTLMIFIALDIEAGELVGSAKGGGVLSLMSDIVIHGNKEKKSWFSQYMKLMQQKYRRHHSSAVTALRKYLMKKLLHFINLTSKSAPSSDIPLSMEVDVNNEGLMEEEGGEEGMDTATLELVDQMEIEISEIEDGETAERGGGGREEGTEKVEGGDGTTEAMETIQSLASKRTHNNSFTFEQIDFPVISLSRQFSDESILQLTQLIHVCCALKTQANMYLTNEESAALLHLITCTCPPFSSAGVQFIEVALSILLTCPFLINSEDGEESVLRWITWLLENIQEFEKAIPGERVYGEMLLLVVIHLQEKQLKEIETLISSVLGMTLQNSLGSGHFSTLKDIFLKVFKGDVVCSHAVSVPPTSSLSGHMTGYLPVHCILQLMRSKAFRKHGVFVKDWIYKQLVTTVEPVHPDLPSLIEEYVQAILVSPLSASSHAKSRRATIVQIPFSAEEVLSVFRFDDVPSESSMCSKILILYYVLYYQETYLSNLKSLLVSSHSDAPKAYSPSVLLQLPVKRLLQHATNNQEAFLTVYPSLLRMIVTQFPQLYLPEDWIRQDDINQSSLSSGSRLRLSSKKVTPEVASALLSTLNTKPSDAMLVLTFLSSLPVTSLVPFSSSLVSSLHLLLEDGVSKRIQQLFSSLWMKLNSVIPRRLWVETVNALRSEDQRTYPLCTHQTILEDPLIVLQCDLRVFRCSCVFEILLRVLAAYTSASRVWLLEHSHKLNCMSQASNDPSVYHLSSQEREELRVALTAAQESGIIQLLLEICLPNDKDREEASVLGPQLTVLREIQCLVCSYLHQVFISEPSMVKLIHFQGYPSQLLPLLVSGVPSMHIATDFLPELLAQPQLEKQVFAIQLAAHVIHQYPLPESVGLVKDSIFKKLHRFIDEVPSKRQHGVFFPLLPAMVLLCQTFPPLTVEAVDFLLHLCRVCLVNSLPGYNGGTTLPLDANTVLHASCNPQQLNITPFDKDAKECRSNKMTSPLFLLEERLKSLRNLSLVEGARWAFDEISKTVLMKVSCKT